jgi:putative restriction endonuclease
VTADELFGLLARLRQARVGDVRVPHKPLLLLWLFGRFAATGSSLATYAEAEEPVSRLINEFGPPVKSPSAARSRAAMPFVHLERELWDLRDGQGREIGPDAPERRGWLTDHEAAGRLRPEVEQLLSDGGTLAAAARLLLDRHFTPLLADLICADVDLDLADLNAAAPVETIRIRRRPRRSGFAEEVLRAYAYQCAMCGFDGSLGRTPVGIEAAHVRWHSQDGPDDVANGLALCALHHVLLDLGVLGLTADRRICVSGLYVARSDAGKAIDALAGQPLLAARPGQPAVDIAYASWHNVQVFKGDHRHPQRKDGRPHAAAAQSVPERALSRLEAADAAASRDE